MKILFSPIGNTDPISDSNFYDGAMLHICRHYDIDKVYMYMSKKIYEKEEADQRFTILVLCQDLVQIKMRGSTS